MSVGQGYDAGFARAQETQLVKADRAEHFIAVFEKANMPLEADWWRGYRDGLKKGKRAPRRNK